MAVEEAVLTYKRNIIIALTSLISVFIMGVVGYTIIERDNAGEGWSLFDAIYMTVITLTTVGYEE